MKSRRIGSGKGTRKRVDDATRQRGSWRRDSRQSWRGTTDRGSQHRTPEQRGEAAWDRVKMSLHSSSFVEFSLVTHASVSPYMLSGMHMHVVLQYLLRLLVNPKLYSCSFVLLHSLDRILVSVKKCALPPRTTSWSPAGVRSDMVRRKLTCGVGREGVALQLFPALKFQNQAQ